MEEEEDRCASLGDNVDGDGKVMILAVGAVVLQCDVNVSINRSYSFEIMFVCTNRTRTSGLVYFYNQQHQYGR